MRRVRSFFAVYFKKGLQEARQGQMLLVVVLTMIVALTVGLSVVSRTITSLKISKQGEESQRAFQAAEAGIEKAIQSGSQGSLNSSLPNNSSYQTSVPSGLNSGTNFLLNAGDQVTQDVGFDVALATNPTYANPYSGTVTYYWNPGNQTSCSTEAGAQTATALEVDIISGQFQGPAAPTPPPTSTPNLTPTPTPTPSTANLTGTYDGDADNDGNCVIGSAELWTRGSDVSRTYIRFSMPTSSIPSGSTIKSVSFVYTVDSDSYNVAASIAPYNNNGQADPQADSCTTRRTRSKPATSYVSNSTSIFDGAGSRHAPVSLGAQAVNDVQAALNAGLTNFSVAVNEGSGGSTSLTGIMNSFDASSSNRPVLTVTYVPPASAPTVDITTAGGIYTGGNWKTVDVKNGPGNPRDWVGLFSAFEPDSAKYISWQYLNGSQTPPAVGITNASLNFMLPANLNGIYEFRFLPDDGSVVTDKTGTFIVFPGTVFSPTLTLSKTVYDPCNGRTSGATAAGGSGVVGGVTFNNSVAIPVTSGIIAKVVPLYGSSIVGVTGTNALPTQGTIVDSTGTSEETVRKVRYYSSNPQIPPEFFPYTILSQ